MGKVFPATQALFAGALALAGGAGVVYAPTLTFAIVAIVFAYGLWWSVRSGGPWASGAELDARPTRRGRSDGDLTGKLVSGYLLVWWLATVVVAGRVYTGAPLEQETLAQGSQQAAAEGVLLNQLLVISYGAIGTLFLLMALRRGNVALRWLLVLWLLYLSWCYTSLFWTIDPSLTVRRLAAFALISLGSIGFGVGFYGSRVDGRSLFLRHVVLAGTLSALALLVPLVFRSSGVNFVDPGYVLRVSSNTWTYVAHPTTLALLTLIAASMLKMRSWANRDWVVVFVLGLAILLLKTRGPVLYAGLALAALYLLYKVRFTDRVLQIGLSLVLLLGAYVLYTGGALEPLLPYLARGDVDVQADYPLSGRGPLWEAVLTDIGQHPLVGVGFGAYWNPYNLARIQDIVGFSAVNAHNGFLEELLATGAIGLGLLSAFWVSTAAVAVGLARRGDRFGWIILLFLVFYVLLNLTQSIMQFYLEVPFIVLLVAVGLILSKPPPSQAG